MRYVLNRDVNARIETVVNVSGNTIELYDYILNERWYEEQPGITAGEFISALNEMSGDILVRINSKGGEVGNALAIYQRLLEYSKGKVTCVVDGYAYSCASWILLAGDERTINTGGIVMVHNPHIYPEISKEEDFDNIRNQWLVHRDSIRNIIVERTGLPSEEVSLMMSSTTFMDADTAIAKNFCHSVQKTKTTFDTSVRNAMPKEVRNVFHDDTDLVLRARAVLTSI